MVAVPTLRCPLYLDSMSVDPMPMLVTRKVPDMAMRHINIRLPSMHARLNVLLEYVSLSQCRRGKCPFTYVGIALTTKQ